MRARALWVGWLLVGRLMVLLGCLLLPHNGPAVVVGHVCASRNTRGAWKAERATHVGLGAWLDVWLVPWQLYMGSNRGSSLEWNGGSVKNGRYMGAPHAHQAPEHSYGSMLSSNTPPLVGVRGSPLVAVEPGTLSPPVPTHRRHKLGS